MGRWAYFHGDSDVEYEYKFWFGIQNSDIPWANCFEELYIPEYDEDEATDIEMSEAQKEIWKKYGDSHVSFQAEELTQEEATVLNEFAVTEYNASDECTEEELQERWAEVNAEARALGLELFTQTDGESPEDAIDRYYENVMDPSCDKDKADEAAIANLYLKTVICAMMPKFGYNYSCHYEC